VLSPETAYLVTSMLTSVVTRGTGRRVRALGRPVAGKTGTTNDMHDAWFVGFTPELATGVWVGYDSERSLGKDQTGGAVAAPIFLDFMQAALGTSPVGDFAVPDGITFVSVEAGSGRPATPDSMNATLECFKTGTEPRWRPPPEEPLFDDELQQAVGRLQERGGAPDEGPYELAPPIELDRDGEPVEDWPSDDEEGMYRGRPRTGESGLDERAPPRAEDYLEPRERPRRPRRLHRNEAEAGEYARPPARRARDIIEEERLTD
jgi:membrane peptidoglycan carboxypeptidase